jgi:GT2 family glycosyltransferase
MNRDEVTFSIVIPTRDRPVQLRECLTALASSDYPHGRFEVIVVNDGGRASALEGVAAQFGHRLDVSLLAQAHAGPAAARNSGALRARGNLLAFTDDDCQPDHRWLAALAARLARAPGHAIGGRTVNGLPANPFATLSQLIVDAGYAYFNAEADRPTFFAANNLALAADRFHEIGGFDATLATYEDRDLCNRWVHRGWPMSYAPDAVVQHFHALTLRTFCRQHYHYGRGARHFDRLRARRGTDRVRIDRRRPDPRFYRQLVGRVRAERGHRRTLLLALLVLAQGANAVGFLHEWVSARPRKDRNASTPRPSPLARRGPHGG